MATKNGKKEIQAVNLSPDVRQMLNEQSKRLGISASAYIERLILEKNWEYKHNNEGK